MTAPAARLRQRLSAPGLIETLRQRTGSVLSLRSKRSTETILTLSGQALDFLAVPVVATAGVAVDAPVGLAA